MSIPVVCPNCSARLNAPDSAAGKRVKCPKCQTAMVVPAAPPAEPAFEVVDETPAKKPAARPKVKTDVTVDEDEPKPRKKRVQAAVEDDGDEQPRKQKKKAAAGNSAMTRNIIGGVVLLVLLGIAGYVFYDKFGKPDDTAGNVGGNPPAQPLQPENPDQQLPIPGQGGAMARMKNMEAAITDLNRALDETAAALNQISNDDTALAAVSRLATATATFRKVNDRLKVFGQVAVAEVGRVPAPSGDGVAALRAAITRTTGLIERKAITGQAADSLAGAVAELDQAVLEVTRTVIAMWPEKPG